MLYHKLEKTNLAVMTEKDWGLQLCDAKQGAW